MSATDPDTVRSHIRVPASMPYMRAAIIDLNAEGHRYSVYMGYLKPATPEYTTLMSNTTVSDEAVSQVVSVDYMAHRALNLPVYFDHQNRDSEGPDAGTLYFQGKFASNAPWITIPAEEVGPGTMAFGAANGNTKSNEIDSSGKFRMFKCEPFPLMRPLLKRGNNSDRHIVGAYAIKSV